MFLLRQISNRKSCCRFQLKRPFRCHVKADRIMDTYWILLSKVHEGEKKVEPTVIIDHYYASEQAVLINSFVCAPCAIASCPGGRLLKRPVARDSIRIPGGIIFLSLRAVLPTSRRVWHASAVDAPHFVRAESAERVRRRGDIKNSRNDAGCY